MLMLPLHKEWFDKIRSGQKTIDYRELKPYWVTRIQNIEKALVKGDITDYPKVLLRNGYGDDKPTLYARIARIEVVSGRDSDLHCNGLVYAIHLKDIEEVNA